MPVGYCTLRTALIMNITNFKTTLIDILLQKPIATVIHSIRSAGCILLELDTIEINNGYIVVPERPGIGFTFDQSAIKRYKSG